MLAQASGSVSKMAVLKEKLEAVHVLAVDDDPLVGEMISDFLGGYDIKVTVSRSGRDIAQVMARETVDLIILDLKLPGEDGMRIAQELRVESDIPIIMLTWPQG
jgi:DNA-binding response OmpR family regulator